MWTEAVVFSHRESRTRSRSGQWPRRGAVSWPGDVARAEIARRGAALVAAADSVAAELGGAVSGGTAAPRLREGQDEAQRFAVNRRLGRSSRDTVYSYVRR
ncbi:UNVERIFIED_ORG: hypothetical protein FHR35_004042 [Microbispora rosea subsp. rosea]